MWLRVEWYDYGLQFTKEYIRLGNKKKKLTFIYNIDIVKTYLHLFINYIN